MTSKQQTGDVKLGLIGLGNMGQGHLGYLHELPGVKLTAIADHHEPNLAKIDGDLYGQPRQFTTGETLIAEADVDAVLIATPHYDHPPLTLQAFKRGLHVLVEKPVAVTAHAAAEVNEAYEKMTDKPVYAAMFQQRTRPQAQAIKRMIDAGELGHIKRISWLITTWFRTQAYYSSGGWRATWSGEGGGVLINQCPHQLDMLQWFVGQPSRVTAKVGLGKYHHIEVEDEVNALLEWDNGATGVFVTTTGDSPGTNRLEITGERGKLVWEDGSPLEFYRNHMPDREFCNTTTKTFAKAPCDKLTIDVGGEGGSHRVITENFIRAIREGEPLLAEATEGIHGLELGNAMLMSGIKQTPIDIPTPREEFERMIQKFAAESNFRKPEVTQPVEVDMNASF